MHVNIDAINNTFYVEAQEPKKAIFEIASSNNNDMNIDVNPKHSHVNIDINSNNNNVNVDVIDKDVVINSGSISSESNDLSSSVTWANVPDANITQSSVTQHESALSITESQISDLSSNGGGDSTRSHSSVNSNTTLATTVDVVIISNLASDIEVTLPFASLLEGKTISFKFNSNQNKCTIFSQSVDYIDGSNSTVLQYKYESISCFSDGDDWYIL